MDLRGVSRTTVWTLYLRALDARRRRPVLGDPWAGPVLDRLGVRDPRLALLRGDRRTIATRARVLDGWTQAFLDDHPDAQVVSLASGLDSRVLRVARPPASTWTDLDLPAVMDLRRRVYDLPDDVRSVGASVDDDAAWADVPDHRPTLVVAEGLLMYLEPAVVARLLARLAARDAPGVLCFDAVAPWVLPASRLTRLLVGDDVRFRWSARSGRAVVRSHPGLRVVDDVPLAPLLAREAVPGPAGRVLAASTRLSPLDGAMRLLRLGFGAG